MNGTPPSIDDSKTRQTPSPPPQPQQQQQQQQQLISGLYVLVDNIRNRWRTPQNTLSFWRHYFLLLFFYPLFIFITRMDR